MMALGIRGVVGLMTAASLVLAPAAAAQVTPTEAPLRMAGGRLVVTVEGPDGAELDFLIGSSVPTTVLSESVQATFGDHPELKLGGIAVPTDNPMTSPDADLTVDGAVYHGIIPPAFFAEYDLLIDAPRGRLVLKPFGRGVSWPGVELSDPIPIRLYHGVVVALDVELGERSYPASLDLANAGLVVNAAVKTELGLDDSDTAVLRIGMATFAGMSVSVEDNEMLQRWSPDGDGFVMVGGGIAEDCAISLSWVHQEMRTCVR